MTRTVPLAVWLSIYGVVFAAQIGYATTLYLTLRSCAPQNRTMPTWLVWLLLIPVWGIFWWFTDVGAMSESLEKEMRSRGAAAQRPYQTVGRMAGWLQAGIVAVLVLDYGLFEVVSTSTETGGNPAADRRLAITLLVVAGLMLAGFLAAWIMYWVKVIMTWRRLGTLGPVRSTELQFGAELGTRPQGAPPRLQAQGAGASWAQGPQMARSAAVEVPLIRRRAARSGPVMDFCPNCGLMTAVDERCPRCGTARKPSTFIE